MSPEQFNAWSGLLSEPLLLLAKDGQVLAANKNVRRLGISRDSLIGKPLTALCQTPDDEVNDLLRLCARSRQPVIAALTLLGPKNEAIPCRCDGQLASADFRHDERKDDTTTVLLKLTPKEIAIEQYKIVNEKIKELNQEIQRRTQLESELNKRNEFLHVTLTSIGDGVIVTDEAAQVTLLNRVAEQLTGWATEAAAGQPLEKVFRIVNEKTRQAVENPAIRALEEGIIIGLANHTVLIARDGTECPIDDSAAPIRAENGDLLGAVLVFRDITERKKAEAAEEEQKRLLALRHGISSALAANEELQPTLQQCAKALVRELDVAFARIWVLDKQQGTLELLASAGLYTHLDGGHSQIKLGEYKIGRIAQNRKPHLTNDVRHDANISNPEWARKECMVAFAGYPLQIGEQVLGVMGMFARHPLSDTVLGDLAPLADGISQFIDRKGSEERLRNSEARLIQMADAIPQLAWICAPDGAATWMNSRWSEYTGMTMEQSQAWGWKSAHDPEFLPQVMERWQFSVETGEPFEMVFPLRGRDGNYQQFLTRVIPMRNDRNEILCWFGTSTDITKQKVMEEELREIAAQLSEADRRKDEFLATLAHELRNPLAPIRTGLEVMKMIKDDPDTMEETRATMERQAKQLVTLIDDLMDVSRITRGKFELRMARVELAGILKSAVEAVQPFISEHGHELMKSVPDAPIYLKADPNRLAQVVANLLNNAAKYTRENGRIWLNVSRVSNTSVAISVKDTGIGIPAEMQETIFDMFTQINPSSERMHSGLGIGLTLVKSLVAMHQGTIEVHSKGSGQGSEFIVQLPTFTHDIVLPKEAPLLQKRSARRCRVLVVDDNRAAAESLRTMLKMFGHDVRTAHDGQDGFKVAEEYRPHLVFLDLGMPRLNGYETALRIRDRPWGKNVAIAAVTGWGQQKDRERTKAAGFDFHLVKPVEPDVMQDVIHSVMKDASPHD